VARQSFGNLETPLSKSALGWGTQQGNHHRLNEFPAAHQTSFWQRLAAKPKKPEPRKDAVRLRGDQERTQFKPGPPAGPNKPVGPSEHRKMG